MVMSTHTPPDGVLLNDQRGLEEKTDELIQQVYADIEDLQPWLDEKLGWWEARFGQMTPTGPSNWGSTIQLPVSDLYCTRTAANLMNIIMGGSRVVTMKPANAEAFSNAAQAERMMEHLLRGGGVNSMPDLPVQISAMLNSCVTYGVGVLKTSYSYKTRMGTEIVRRDAMPGILRKLVVVPNMTEAERRDSQQRFPDMNPPEFQAVFGSLDINPINKAVFDRIAPVLRSEIVRLYGLYQDDKADRAAVEELMTYLRTGHKEPSVAITKREILEDCPRLRHIPIQDFIVPAGAMLDLTRCERVTERAFYSESQMKELAADETWVKSAVELALESGSTDISSQRWSSSADLITQAQLDYAADYSLTRRDRMYEVLTIHHYEDLHGSGMPSLVVSTVEPTTKALLRKESFMPAHGQLPYTVIPYEVTEQTYRAPRGIPKIISHLEDHINAWYRWLEDTMQITTSVSFAVNRDSVSGIGDLEWFPGLVLEVDDPSRDIQPIPMPQYDVPIERLEQFLMLWPERLIGDLSQTLTNGNPPERRTATEVATLDANRQRMMDMRARIIVHALERPLQQIWSLWQQFGPTEAFVHITGEPPERLTQHQIRGRYRVMPMAAVGPMDPSVRTAQLGQIMDLAIRMQPIIDQDVRYDTDLAQMFVDLARTVDPLSADRNIRRRSQQEVEQVLQVRQQQAAENQEIAALADKAMANAMLEPKEALKLLQVIKSSFPWKEGQQIAQAAEIEQAANVKTSQRASQDRQ